MITLIASLIGLIPFLYVRYKLSKRRNAKRERDLRLEKNNVIQFLWNINKKIREQKEEEYKMFHTYK